MNELVEKYGIDDGLYIYLQRNSKVWLARFKIDGKWIARTTKQRDKAKAITGAIKVKAECDIKLAHGIAIHTKAFRDVAQVAIERMQEQPKTTKGYASLADYEQVLRRYHIRFFDRTYVTSIDYDKLAEFDRWRTEQLGRTPAQSTLKTHNAALQRVFDVAVNRKWMAAYQVPALSAASGVAKQRRDHFTTQEIEKINKAFPEWVAASRKEVTRQLRELLFFYFNVAVHTGLRPGTEMDNLKWRDLEMKDAHVVITVRKGKTTLHTGTRYVVGHRTVLDMILDMSARFDEVKDDDLVFRLSDGSTTNQLGRNFVALLKHLGLDKSASGTRTLYSLRHTYITQLMLAGLPPSVIAKQCGTSTAMIEQHYSHITPLMYAKELAGGEGAELTKLINKYADLA